MLTDILENHLNFTEYMDLPICFYLCVDLLYFCQNELATLYIVAIACKPISFSHCNGIDKTDKTHHFSHHFSSRLILNFEVIDNWLRGGQFILECDRIKSMYINIQATNIIDAMENSKEQNSQPKSSKIKIFRTIQKKLCTLGIEPNSAMRLNRKVFISLLSLGLGNVGMLVYMLTEAKTFLEFTQPIYVCSAYTIAMFILLIMIWNSSRLYQNINDGERFINTSKCEKLICFVTTAKLANLCSVSAFNYSASQSIFNEANRRVENLSGILFFVITKITPGLIVLPISIYSFFVYFTTDSGPNAFKLPFPMWWAWIRLYIGSFAIRPSNASNFICECKGFHSIGKMLLDIWSPSQCSTLWKCIYFWLLHAL